MDAKPLNLWCNAQFPETAMDELRAGIGTDRLLLSSARQKLNLAAGQADPLLVEADVAFGQPDPNQITDLSNLRWTHLTTAGYTRYDTAEVRTALSRRGAALTNSSSVYSEPCAEHVLSMMLALVRQLPQCLNDQLTTQSWKAAEHRRNCRLLEGQTALILGLGAIAHRLIELLQPFRMNLVAVRRTLGGDEPIRTFPFREVARLVPEADHIVNLLPANASTEDFFNADLIGRMKPTAFIYNIGRGTTVDAIALRTALEIGRIAGAYLDVTDPEPLPPDHPLWRLPNCWITPHTAGGHHNEFSRLVRHFLDNLRRFHRGESLKDRVV